MLVFIGQFRLYNAKFIMSLVTHKLSMFTHPVSICVSQNNVNTSNNFAVSMCEESIKTENEHLEMTPLHENYGDRRIKDEK